MNQLYQKIVIYFVFTISKKLRASESRIREVKIEKHSENASQYYHQEDSNLNTVHIVTLSWQTLPCDDYQCNTPIKLQLDGRAERLKRDKL